jgi:hypothetical protein
MKQTFSHIFFALFLSFIVSFVLPPIYAHHGICEGAYGPVGYGPGCWGDTRGNICHSVGNYCPGCWGTSQYVSLCVQRYSPLWQSSCGNCGTYDQSGNCANQGCSPGSTENGPACGNCGTQRRTCQSNCQWSSYDCVPGTCLSEMCPSTTVWPIASPSNAGQVSYLECSQHEFVSNGNDFLPCEWTGDIRTAAGRQYVCTRGGSGGLVECAGDGAKLGNQQGASLSTGGRAAYTRGLVFRVASQLTVDWEASAWGSCSVSCGGGTQTRTVVCKRSDGVVLSDSHCDSLPKPFSSQGCNTQICGYYCNCGPSGPNGVFKATNVNGQGCSDVSACGNCGSGGGVHWHGCAP